MASLHPDETVAPASGRMTELRRWLAESLERRFELERDQLPLWLPVGLGLGIAGWFALPVPQAWTGFLLTALAVALAALAAAPATRWGRAIAIFAFAAALGCALIWVRAERVASPVLAYPRMADFTAVVETVQPVPAQQMTRLVVRPNDETLPRKVRVNIDQKQWLETITPGASVRIRAWLMPPAPKAVPGAYDFARVAWFQGIGASGRAQQVELRAAADSTGWRATIANWRQWLSAHIRGKLGGSAGGIATALATGDQGGISEADAQAMRDSGLAHLLSVSGLHLSAVVGAVMLLTLRVLAVSPTLALRWPLLMIAAGVGAVAAIAYTLLTGSEIPTIRACIAAVLILIGIALGREALTLRLVATGALVVLLLWPESLAGPSFQLSFAAMTAIVALHEHAKIRALLSRRDEGLAQKGGRILLGLVLTGLAVELALSPIALYHFHRSGLYGALANIVAIPLTTFIIMPLEALALLFDVIGLGGPFWWLTGRALDLLLGLAQVTATAPGAVATLPSMPSLAFALMIGGGLWLLLWRSNWRRWGLLPVVVGAGWALLTPSPDLIVTGDGRHLALRTGTGTYAILRERAGDYVRDLFSETSGTDEELELIDALPGARCNRDLCSAVITRGGAEWHLLATRSSLLVPIEEISRACASTDLVVSDRRLPVTCRPRWMKADRLFLQRTGGLAIRLGDRPEVTTVAGQVGAHPWVRFTAAPKNQSLEGRRAKQRNGESEADCNSSSGPRGERSRSRACRRPG